MCGGCVLCMCCHASVLLCQYVVGVFYVCSHASVLLLCQCVVGVFYVCVVMPVCCCVNVWWVCFMCV